MQDTIITISDYTLVFPLEAKQLLLAAIVGFFIGLEREKKGKPASLRTFSFICTGSCLFTILSVQTAGTSVEGFPYDVTRIAAQIVTGIGFLGAGVILKTGNKIEGITTAALIWLTAAIGMACGFNHISLVFWGFVISVFMHIFSLVIYRILKGPLEAEDTE